MSDAQNIFQKILSFFRRGTKEGDWRYPKSNEPPYAPPEIAPADEPYEDAYSDLHPEGSEYWKTDNVNRNTILMIIHDLEFPQAWLNVGYGSSLAQRRVNYEQETYLEQEEGTWDEIINGLEYHSAIRSFITLIRNPASDAYLEYHYPYARGCLHGYPFLELFWRVCRKDLITSADYLEELMDNPGVADIETFREIMSFWEVLEWDTLAIKVIKEQEYLWNDEFPAKSWIEEKSMHHPEFFETMNGFIPADAILIKKYHRLLTRCYI
jgi:hypothetical protein